jgi:putative mRNA 3-end processing factor
VPEEIVRLTEYGLYCELGDFFIDPWRPVGRAVITHAHADHARGGNVRYLAARPGERILKARLGPDAAIQTIDYGDSLQLNSVNVSLHPAGHVLGSAQIRIEYKGQVWVVSGDYKVEPDSTCQPLEPIECNTFITESTFGLPIYRWHHQSQVFDEINRWWQRNKEAGKASLLFAYSLGKAQRLLAGVDPTIGPIYAHGAVYNMSEEYRASGIALPHMAYVADMARGTKYGGSLILAPPSAIASQWTRQFGPTSTAFASGWMRIRGTRRRRSIDRGFVLSDHADWPGLNEVIQNTGAERVIVTHGYSAELVRWLLSQGIDAQTMRTEFAGELDDQPPSGGEQMTHAGTSYGSTSEGGTTQSGNASIPDNLFEADSFSRTANLQMDEPVDHNLAAWTVKVRDESKQAPSEKPFGSDAPFLEDSP